MPAYHEDAISIMLIFLRQFKGEYNDIQIQQGIIGTARLMPEVDAGHLFADIKQLAENYPGLFVRHNKTSFAVAYGQVVAA